MRGAIIGFGVIAEGHLYAYDQIDELEIIAVTDCQNSRCERAKGLISNVMVFKNVKDMFENVELDFVDVCVPPYKRYEIMKEALLRGCHVIGEKPFLLEEEHYMELTALAKHAGKILYPSHNYKFAPIMKSVNKIISNNGIGYLMNGHFRTLRSGHAKGVDDWIPDWRIIEQYSGGGIVRDHGPHSIYMACSLIGCYPQYVSCIMGSLKLNNTVEDTAMIKLYFSNEIQFDIDISWASNVRSTSYYLFGSRGCIMADDDVLKYSDKNGSIISNNIISDFNDPSHKNWFVDVLNDFSESIEKGNYRYDLLYESYLTLIIINAAYKSAKADGEKIKLSEKPIELWINS